MEIRSPEESRGAVVVENLLQGGVEEENHLQACWRESLVNVITLHWRFGSPRQDPWEHDFATSTHWDGTSRNR